MRVSLTLSLMGGAAGLSLAGDADFSGYFVKAAILREPLVALLACEANVGQSAESTTDRRSVEARRLTDVGVACALLEVEHIPNPMSARTKRASLPNDVVVLVQGKMLRKRYMPSWGVGGEGDTGRATGGKCVNVP